MVINRITKTLLLFTPLLLSIFNTKGYATTIEKTEIVYLIQEDHYKATVQIKGSQGFKQEKFIIGYTELENIEDLTIKIKPKSKNRFKKVKTRKAVVDGSIPKGSFYDGYRGKIFNLEKKSDFKISYSVHSNEPVTLSYLGEKIMYYFSDTLIIKINLEDNLTLLADIPESLTTYYDFESDTLSSTEIQYILIKKEGLNKENITKNIIRCLVIPKEQSKDPWKYFSNWYTDLSMSRNKLNETAKSKLYSLIDEKDDFTQHATVLLDYIKYNIQYLDIEAGMQAFQPEDVNTVLHNKQGDCKGVSNLLSAWLRELGYESYLSLSATHSHIFELDFPSLSSANHVICAVKFDDNWFFLDPTSFITDFPNPSSEIQNTYAFITWRDYYELKYINHVPAKNNKKEVLLDLTLEDKIASGKIIEKNIGKSRNLLRYMQKSKSTNEFNSFIPLYLSTYYPEISFDSTKVTTATDTVRIEGNVSINKTITTYNNNTYVPLKFLPIKSITIDNKHDGYGFLDNAINKEVVVKLCLGKQISTIQINSALNKIYADEDKIFQFQFHPTFNGSIITINLNIFIDKVKIKEAEFEHIKQINEHIVNVLDKTIKVSYE